MYYSFDVYMYILTHNSYGWYVQYVQYDAQCAQSVRTCAVCVYVQLYDVLLPCT